MNKVNVTVKYKQPGKRGYQYRHTSRSRSLSEAAYWMQSAWSDIERHGGTVIQGYVNPA